MNNTQHPSPWSGKSFFSTCCTVGLREESLFSMGHHVKVLGRYLQYYTKLSSKQWKCSVLFSNIISIITKIRSDQMNYDVAGNTEITNWMENGAEVK